MHAGPISCGSPQSFQDLDGRRQIAEQWRGGLAKQDRAVCSLVFEGAPTDAAQGWSERSITTPKLEKLGNEDMVLIKVRLFMLAHY